MKKIFSLTIAILISFSLGFSLTVPVNATYNDPNNMNIVEPTEEEIYDLINGETVVINDENGDDFYVLVPAVEDIYEIETASILAGVRIFFEIVGAALAVCTLIDYYDSTYWNPCKSAVQEVKKAVNSRPGKYTYGVTRKYVNPPSKPGCVPMHSYQCNTPGYYIYSFVRVL